MPRVAEFEDDKPHEECGVFGVWNAGDAAALTAQQKVTELSDSAVATLRKAEDAAGKLAGALDLATNGQGTMGQLMNNPDLYNSLKDATTRLDKALTEFQLLAEKFRTEGVRLKL